MPQIGIIFYSIFCWMHLKKKIYAIAYTDSWLFSNLYFRKDTHS